MEWFFLAGAILVEVAATMALRVAVSGRKIFYAAVVVGYLLAFSLITLALAEGMPLGVAYGVWAATGVALTAILSHFIFKEPFGWIMAAGIALVVGGVLLVEIGATAG